MNWSEAKIENSGVNFRLPNRCFYPVIHSQWAVVTELWIPFPKSPGKLAVVPPTIPHLLLLPQTYWLNDWLCLHTYYRNFVPLPGWLLQYCAIIRSAHPIEPFTERPSSGNCLSLHIRGTSHKRKKIFKKYLSNCLSLPAASQIIPSRFPPHPAPIFRPHCTSILFPLINFRESFTRWNTTRTCFEWHESMDCNCLALTEAATNIQGWTGEK